MPEPNWTPVEAAFYELLRSLLTVWNEVGLPPEARSEVEALLAQAKRGQLGALNRARRRLLRHEQVRPWLEREQASLLEEENLRLVRLPGDPTSQERPAFCCPTSGCEYVWYQRVAAVIPPPCPIHGCDLDRADSS